MKEIERRRRRIRSDRAVQRVVEALEGRALLAAVPELVADLNTLPNGSAPGQFVEFNGALYFTATADNYGRELWRTDGTRAGTRIVQDINPGGGDGAVFSGWPVVFKDAMYFIGRTPESGDELWRSDGTSEGTRLVSDINPGAGSSSIAQLTVAGDSLFFTANVSGGRELWKSDGTETGTSRVKDIWAGAQSSNPGQLTAVGETLFFTATDNIAGIELWKSDGTESGTQLVKDIYYGSNFGALRHFTEFNGALYFTVDPGTSTNVSTLYRSDGTEAGTTSVGNTRVTWSQSVGGLVESDGWLYFANNGALWKSDGTASGTSPVITVVPQGNPDSLSRFTPVGGDKILFLADNSDTGVEPWDGRWNESVAGWGNFSEAPGE